ncbi:MAG: TMEM165/GDT1 family protein [Sphingobium sp.]
MDALLFALIGALLGTIGDKSQHLVLAFANRFDRNGLLIAAILLAAAFNSGISAIAGAFIGPMLSSDARLLFLALSLLFLGVGMIWRTSPPDPLTRWRIGAFATSFVGLFILLFGDGQQFLILGLATRTGDPVLVAIGGTLGIAAGLVPVVIGRDAFLATLPLTLIRRVAGCVMLLVGAVCALSAVGIA